MTPNIFTAFRTSLIGVVAATVLVLTAAAPANACGDGPREFLYSVGAVIPADHWRYLLTTGDLIVRVDPITGDRVSVETVTTTPWERALAVEEAQAQAEIRAERDALAAGNGPTYDEQVTYNRNRRRKDRGEFRAPTVTLVGCVERRYADPLYVAVHRRRLPDRVVHRQRCRPRRRQGPPQLDLQLHHGHGQLHHVLRPHQGEVQQAQPQHARELDHHLPSALDPRRVLPMTTHLGTPPNPTPRARPEGTRS